VKIVYFNYVMVKLFNWESIFENSIILSIYCKTVSQTAATARVCRVTCREDVS